LVFRAAGRRWARRAQRRARSQAHRQRGAATVEHSALALLIALVLGAAIAVVAADPPERAARELAGAIARKLRCASALPGPCWRDPLTTAYGRQLAGLVRALAPEPEARIGPGGEPLLPVHFRHCRSPSCARPGPRPELTASNRRVTVFVAVHDRRRRGGGVVVDYWEYRPTLGWALQRRRATSADVARYARTPLPETAHPRLVPLETLAGRNHVGFAPGEEPPWRWRVRSVG
jgi:hypothetical protein